MGFCVARWKLFQPPSSSLRSISPANAVLQLSIEPKSLNCKYWIIVEHKGEVIRLCFTRVMLAWMYGLFREWERDVRKKPFQYEPLEQKDYSKIWLNWNNLDKLLASDHKLEKLRTLCRQVKAHAFLQKQAIDKIKMSEEDPRVMDLSLKNENLLNKAEPEVKAEDVVADEFKF